GHAGGGRQAGSVLGGGGQGGGEHGGQEGPPRGTQGGAHRRAISGRRPAGAPTSSRPFQTSWPLTQVEAMRERKVVPSNGDQPHLDSTSSRRTVSGASSTSTRSAQ